MQNSLPAPAPAPATAPAPAPGHLMHAIQTHFAPLWKDSTVSFWFDSHPFSQHFSTQRPNPPGQPNVAMCFTPEGVAHAVQTSIPTIISNQPSLPKYTSLPIHNSLFLAIQQSNQLQPFAILPNPPIAQDYLWFNASKCGPYMLSRISEEKWGPSMLALTRLDTGEVRLVNDGNPAHDIYEDPRLFFYKGSVYAAVTCITNYTTGIHTSSRLGIINLSDTCSPPPARIPLYGKNKETGPEKNWGFFEAADGSLCAIYSYSPWVVIQVNEDNSCSERVRKSIAAIPSSTHGATCPVLAPSINGCLLMWAFGRTLTGYIAVAFDSSTMHPIGYSPCPFFSKERFAHQLFYAGSAEYDPQTKEWLFIGGLNDVKNVIIRIPHASIIADFISID
jgi:hypothetical protein